MLTTLVALSFCLLRGRAVLANPTAVALPDAIAAASASCPVSTNEIRDTRQLARDLQLQSGTVTPILTCSNVDTRSAFLNAVALPQPSGYPGDADILPSLVVQPAGAAGVVQAVRFAAAHNLTLAVKGGGWSARNIWRADKGMTIDLSAMSAVHVDAVKQEISVQGGAVYSDILAATEPYDLALPWGDAVQTGMGLALAGGIGYLLRPHGLTVDNIINASVVLANGTQVIASSSENADLLAAMRGGGTVFGVVTDVAFRVYDISNYHGGVIAFADDTNCTTLRAAHGWAVKAMAQEATLAVEILASSAAPGQNVVQLQVGMPGSVPDQLRQDIIAPLQDLPRILQDSLDTLNFTAFERSVTSQVEAQTYKSAYWISAVLTFQQAEEGLLDLLPYLLHDIPADFTYTYLADYLGSTISDNAVKNTTSFTAFGGEIDYHFFIKYEWPAGVNDAANSALAQERVSLISPYVNSTQPYYNLATVVNNATLEYQVGGASNLAELRRLKVELDRDNLFSRHGLIGL